jgi:hypothetical protein
LASAPAAPDSVKRRREASASGGQAWTVTWLPVAGAVGYEILVRRTTSPTWEQAVPVGRVTRYVLPFQLDDGWAGVRAVGADGHRSLARVAGPVAPPVPIARPPQ